MFFFKKWIKWVPGDGFSGTEALDAHVGGGCGHTVGGQSLAEARRAVAVSARRIELSALHFVDRLKKWAVGVVGVEVLGWCRVRIKKKNSARG